MRANNDAPPHQEYICEHCKTKFRCTPYAMESGNKAFCKRACWEEWRTKRPTRFNQLLTLTKAARSIH